MNSGKVTAALFLFTHLFAIFICALAIREQSFGDMVRVLAVVALILNVLPAIPAVAVIVHK